MKLAIALVVCLVALAEVRTPAPAFRLKDAVGKPVSLEKYRGKVVLLNFWATWCGGCKEEMPQFDALQRTLGTKKFAVLGVSVDEKGWDVVKPFLASKMNVGYRVMVADEAMTKYAVQLLPATFLIDKKGNIAEKYTGLVNPEQLGARVRALLAAR